MIFVNYICVLNFLDKGVFVNIITICETQIEIGPELVPWSLCPPVALPVPAT